MSHPWSRGGSWRDADADRAMTARVGPIGFVRVAGTLDR
jgi:hypothetical protein